MQIIQYVLAAILILFLMIAATMAVFEFSGNKMAQGETITILRGQNAFQITADLKAEDYINSKILFLFELVKSGNFRNLKSGEYDLKNLTNQEIIDKMSKGITAPKIATIIPGQTLRNIQNDPQIKKILKSNNFENVDIAPLKDKFDFLKEIPKDGDLEGYLFPDTYQLPETLSADDLILAALKNFATKLDRLGRQNFAVKNLTVRDAVIMASILEKEVKTLEDKKIVAGILYKRIAADMPMQADATLLYYKAGNPDHFDKEIDSPYNTYKHAGLPPGPICNPGFESLEAAIEPVKTDYWYYLSAPDGATIFAKTYDEHRQNISQYLDKN